MSKREIIRIYTNESVNVAIAEGLRRRGVNAISAKDVGNLGLTDEDQLKYALKEKLVIFTHDDDFLGLVRKSKLEHCGIILALIVPYYVALHLALAEKRNVDYFITCDDSIIKLYRKQQVL